MKAINIIQPQAQAWPIAIDGKKNNIPQNPTGSELASVSEGFPAITMKPIKEGGLPPRGEDCNGLFYLSTDQKVFLQNGGIITFNQTVSDLIEGYPKGAVLDYLNSNGVYYKVESLIDDNTNNFIENPQYIDNINWKKINYDSDLSTKANVDADNFTNEGKEAITSLAFPSTTSVDLTLGASDTVYTAPADGWFHLTVYNTGLTWLYMENQTTKMDTGVNASLWDNFHLTNEIQANKGDEVLIRYKTDGSISQRSFYFVLANGYT